MNYATNTKITTVLTAVATFIGILQTSFTSPPLPSETVFVLSGVCTYAMLIVTAWKQYFSNDISNDGARVTVFIAIAATLTGFLDLINVFHISPIFAQWIKWSISIVVLSLNIFSKTFFPSENRRDAMERLKRFSNN